MVEQGLGLCVTEGDQLYTLPMDEAGVSRCRYGRKAAVLTLGHHWARNWTPWICPGLGPPNSVQTDTSDSPANPTQSDRPRMAQPRQLIHAQVKAVSYSPTEGVEIEVDQGLDHLVFTPCRHIHWTHAAGPLARKRVADEV